MSSGPGRSGKTSATGFVLSNVELRRVLGLRVWVLGFRVWVQGLRVVGLGFSGLGLRVRGLGFKVYGFK